MDGDGDPSFQRQSISGADDCGTARVNRRISSLNCAPSGQSDLGGFHSFHARYGKRQERVRKHQGLSGTHPNTRIHSRASNYNHLSGPDRLGKVAELMPRRHEIPRPTCCSIQSSIGFEQTTGQPRRHHQAERPPSYAAVSETAYSLAAGTAHARSICIHLVVVLVL